MIILLSIESVTSAYRNAFIEEDGELTRRDLVTAARFTSTGSVPSSSSYGEGQKAAWFARYKSGPTVDSEEGDEDEEN